MIFDKRTFSPREMWLLIVAGILLLLTLLIGWGISRCFGQAAIVCGDTVQMVVVRWGWFCTMVC